MIPDKTQELDLRELMARYEREYVPEAEREYASEAERQFFEQDWSKLVTKCADAALEAGEETDGSLANTKGLAARGRAKPSLRDWVRRVTAKSGHRGALLPRWIPVSMLIGIVLSGLGFLMLDREGEAKTSSAPAQWGPTSAATTPAPVHRAEAPARPALSTSHDETGRSGAPAMVTGKTSSLDGTNLGAGRSPLTMTPVNAESTLARQAVDAVLAGDHARALQLYRELSRRAPQSEVYREATRILSRTPALSSKVLVEREAAPSPAATEAR